MSLHYRHPSESVELFQRSLCGVTKFIQSDYQQRLLCKLLQVRTMAADAVDCCTVYSTYPL